MQVTVNSSVADPGCLSRIPDPDFYPSRISDPGSKNSNKRGGVEKNLFLYLFFCSHKFHKIENYFIFVMLKKKIWATFQRIIELFTQKFGTNLSKIWVSDPGPRVKKALDPGSGSATPLISRDVPVQGTSTGVVQRSYFP